MSETQQSTLPFDENFQNAVVGYLINDRHFLGLCHGTLESSVFQNPQTQRVVEIVYGYYSQFTAAPSSIDELCSVIAQTYAYDYTAGKNLSNHARLCYLTKDSFRIQIIQNHLADFVRGVKSFHLLSQMASAHSKKDANKVLDLMKRGATDLEAINFAQEQKADFTNFTQFYQDYEQSLKVGCCTIGHPDFDELLREGARVHPPTQGENSIRSRTRGGLEPGKTTIIAGPTNSGKTSTITSIIIQNVLMGKDVHYTGHEQSAQELMDKCIKCITGLPTGEEIRIAGADINHPKHTMIKSCEAYLTRHLTYVHWIKADNMYVEPVMARLIKDNDIHKQRHGKGYDLVVNDYPGKLGSKSLGKNTAKHDALIYIYDQFVNFGKQEMAHMMLPVQINRSGSQANSSGDRQVEMEDIGGSYGIPQLADNVIIIGRNKADIDGKRIKYYLSKSRSNTTKTTFVSATNFKVSRVLGFDLSSTVFSAGEEASPEAITMRLNGLNPGRGLPVVNNGFQFAQDADVDAISRVLNAEPPSETLQ